MRSAASSAARAAGCSAVASSTAEWPGAHRLDPSGGENPRVDLIDGALGLDGDDALRLGRGDPVEGRGDPLLELDSLALEAIRRTASPRAAGAGEGRAGGAEQDRALGMQP